MKQGMVCGLLWIFFLVVGATLFYLFGRSLWEPYYQKNFMIKNITPKECNRSVIQKNITALVCEEPECNCPQCLEENLSSQQKLKRHLADSDFVIYPDKLMLIGLKYEKVLEVWGELHGKWQHIYSYPFSAFSGRLGPKLEEGDRQIPEGVYRVTFLNPKSKFHLSLRLNYPNAFDKMVAKRDKRTDLGGDIMIHGSDRTVGCIPIGDEAIEELYFLAQKVGVGNINVILSPIDFRVRDVEIKNDKYPWLKGLYTRIKKEMEPFRH